MNDDLEPEVWRVIEAVLDAQAPREVEVEIRRYGAKRTPRARRSA